VAEGFDPTARFTGRAAVYHAARPSYPEAVLDFLAQHAGLDSHSRVLDLGMGTGIFTQLLLLSGASVTGLEPNADMREVALQTVGANPAFVAVGAPAEETGLPEAAFDLATAAQAYHWFDEARLARELKRVLRPPHRFFAVWNERDHSSEFVRDYDVVVRRYRDAVGQAQRDNNSFPTVLEPSTVVEFQAPNAQRLDYQSLVQRAESNSGFQVGSPQAHQELEQVFRKHATGDTVVMPYITVGWLGEVRLLD